MADYFERCDAESAVLHHRSDVIGSEHRFCGVIPEHKRDFNDHAEMVRIPIRQTMAKVSVPSKETAAAVPA